MKNQEEYKIIDVEITNDEYTEIIRKEASKIVNLFLNTILVYSSGGLLKILNSEKQLDLLLSMSPILLAFVNTYFVLKYNRGLFDKHFTKVFDFCEKRNNKEKKLVKE